MTPAAIVTADELNNEVYARLGPSKIQGVGVIAVREIPAGVAYNRHWNDFYGYLVQITKEEWAKVAPEIQNIILDSGCFTDGEEPGTYVFEHPNSHHCFFVNHSDTPNTKDGVALVDIAVGEEITRYCNNVHYEVIKHLAAKGIIIKNDNDMEPEQNTLWRPDTCACEVTYAWKKSEKEAERQHRIVAVNPCEIHKGFGTMEEIGAEIFAENQHKNITLRDVHAAIPKLYNEDIVWEYDEQRKLTLTVKNATDEDLAVVEAVVAALPRETATIKHG